MSLFASLGASRPTRVSFHVPARGAWVADLDLDAASTETGSVVFSFGSLSLHGTVITGFTGSFVSARKIRIVGGAGGWGRICSPKDYHNDAGVSARAVATGAASEAGETLGTFEPQSHTIGRDYVRRRVAASRVLEDASGHGEWWVDYDGRTNVAASRSSGVASGYDLLMYSPRDRVAVVAADDPASIGIGSILQSTRLSAPQTVREIEWVMVDEKLRGLAWCGDAADGSRLSTAMRSIVSRMTDGRLFGKWRYRVVKMAGARVELQAVSRTAGLPDTMPLDEVPGVAGAWAQLTPGAEVLVEFVEGNPAMPVLTSASPRAWSGSGAGFVPERLTLGADSPATAKDAARAGDVVKCILGPFVINAMATPGINGVPQVVVGTVTPIGGVALGSIQTGSSKVGIGD